MGEPDHPGSRIRKWNIRGIEETRGQLAAVADGFLALRQKDSATARQKLGAVNEPLLANARLVGDAEALRMLGTAVLRAQRVLKGNPFVRNLRLGTTNPWTDEDRNQMHGARNAILNALERQQVRALRDEPLVELSPDEILAIPELADADSALLRVAKEAGADGPQAASPSD